MTKILRMIGKHDIKQLTEVRIEPKFRATFLLICQDRVQRVFASGKILHLYSHLILFLEIHQTIMDALRSLSSILCVCMILL